MIRILDQRFVAPELVQQTNIVKVKGERCFNLDKREIVQFERGREDVVQAQQSDRVIAHPNESLGERAETCVVNTLDCSKHCKLEVVGCKTRRSNGWEIHTSSTSCFVIILLSNRSANASSFEAMELDVGRIPRVKLRWSPVKMYLVVGRAWSAW